MDSSQFRSVVSYYFLAGTSAASTPWRTWSLWLRFAIAWVLDVVDYLKENPYVWEDATEEKSEKEINSESAKYFFFSLLFELNS